MITGSGSLTVTVNGDIALHAALRVDESSVSLIVITASGSLTVTVNGDIALHAALRVDELPTPLAWMSLLQ